MRNSTCIAVLLLAVMAALLFSSSLGDSATMDELAHIPAGYSYLTQKDYRLNPEHPPLAKDLAALPLLFLNLHFPTDAKAWSEDINGQWDMGRIFLYESGNNPDQILLYSRIPMMLLALLFGWLLFCWVRRRYGGNVALFALFFFVFSPTFIAHSRYVTTDLAAAFGFFIGIITFVEFLEKQSTKRLLIAGLSLGIALLLKFSLILLIPFYLLLAALWVLLSGFEGLHSFDSMRQKITHLFWKGARTILKLGAIFAIALVLILVVYQFHVWNYPPERQVRDTDALLATFGFRPVVDLTIWTADKPILRAGSQYLLGFLMVIQRAAGGNTAYFLGDVSNTGWWYYFPVGYLLKVPFSFLILGAIAFFVALRSLIQTRRKSLRVVVEWMQGNFALTASILFIAIYWIQSMQSLLNIGVRHLLPTFPFIYLLVSRELARWLKKHSYPDPQNIRERLADLYGRYIKSLPKYLFVGILLLWMVLSIAITYPHYLSYYNELAGGATNGYRYIVDSNYDWGQDLKRLRDFAGENQIEKIAVDYFGGGSPSYYLGEKFEPWWSARGKPNPETGDPEWFAISATFRQGAFGRLVRGFERAPEDSYFWLRDAEPVSRVGYSIFIYRF